MLVSTIEQSCLLDKAYIFMKGYVYYQEENSYFDTIVVAETEQNGLGQSKEDTTVQRKSPQAHNDIFSNGISEITFQNNLILHSRASQKVSPRCFVVFINGCTLSLIYLISLFYKLLE